MQQIRGYWLREDISDFQKSKWFLKRPYSFLSQKNQGRSQLAKTGKFPLACGSLTPKKGSFKTSFVYAVLVSVSIAINNQNRKYLGWLQYPLFSVAIQRCVSTQIFLKQYTRIRACMWQDEIFKTSTIYLLSLYFWCCTNTVLCCPSVPLKQFLNWGAFTC